MKTLHEFLARRLPWYARLHGHAYISLVNWAIFFAIAILYTTTLVSTINASVADVGTEFFTAAVSASRGRATPEVKPEAVVERLRVVNNAVITQMGKHSDVTEGQLPDGAGQARVSIDAFRNRQNTLQELALTNPKEVRSFVFDTFALSQLPEVARPYAEKPFEKTGTFNIWIAENFEEKHYEEWYYLDVSPKERYRVALTEDEAHQIGARAKLTMKGMELTNGVVVPTAMPTGEAVAAPEMVSLPTTTTIKKIAVVALNFKDDTSQPITTDELRRVIFTDPKSVAAYYREVSYGQWDIQGRDRVDGDIYGWITIDANTGNCDFQNWRTKAKEKLSTQGVNLDEYTRVVYALPGNKSECSNGFAFAEYFGDAVIMTFQGNLTGVIIHELGHSFGLRHSSGYGLYGTCFTASSFAGACWHNEYGDSYDIMGNGFGLAVDDFGSYDTGSPAFHFNGVHKAKYWLRPDQLLTVTQSGRYTLDPIEFDTPGYKLIRVSRPFAVATEDPYVRDGYYYLEYKRPYGFDAFLENSVVVNSVQVHLASGDLAPSSLRGTHWLGITGGGKPINQNNPLIDNDGGVEIRVATTTATNAVVDIVITPKNVCLGDYPTIAVLSNNPWITPGSIATFNLVVTSNDPKDCPSRSYRAQSIAFPGTESFAQNPQELMFTVLPGETKIVPFSLSIPTNTAPQIHTVFMSVIDNYPLNSHKITASTTVFNVHVLPATTDTTPPIVTIKKPLGGATVAPSTALAIEAVATDRSNIASIELFLDGKLIKTCKDNVSQSTSTCTHTVYAPATLGNHTIMAKAIDNSTSKNVSQATSYFYVSAPIDTTPPAITITSPTQGSTITDAPVNISVSAGDKSGIISLSIYLDGVRLQTCTGTSANQQLACKATVNGATLSTRTHTIMVEAVDASANKNKSTASVTVQKVASTDTTPPAITITSPMQGSTITDALVNITASATDASGISSVSIYGNGVLLQTCTGTNVMQLLACKATVNGAILPAGTHTVTIEAVDASANKNKSTASVTVQKVTSTDTTPPAITITSPTQGSTITDALVNIAVSTQDTSGISSVSIYGNGVLLQTCTGTSATQLLACKATVNGAILPAGRHMVTVEAVDASANKNKSTASVTVQK